MEIGYSLHMRRLRIREIRVFTDFFAVRSTQNGDENVYGKGWYFQGGKLSGATDGNRKHDKNDLSPIQQVYKLIVNTNASATLNSVSGKVTPYIDEVGALPVQEDRFGGNATIKLDIFGTSYHKKQYSILNPTLSAKDKYYPRKKMGFMVKLL